MSVKELMTKAKCCGQGTSVKDVARMMKEENIGFVPICNGSGEPIAAVTDRDLAIRVLAEGRSADEPIDSFATRDVVSCRSGDDIRDAARLMRERRKSRVMVCGDDGKLQGVISLADIADAQPEPEAGRTLQEVKSDHAPAH
jgi:CBS domain-containing protein